jgi:hypothetical protein
MVARNYPYIGRTSQYLLHDTPVAAIRIAIPSTSVRARTSGGSSMSAHRSSADDAALAALDDLIGCIDESVEELQRARVRAEHLMRERRAGRPWLEMVTAESRPLVVESVSTVLAKLATAGHRWRREEAAALQREQISNTRSAALFGVTRQRISALLRDQDGEPAA